MHGRKLILTLAVLSLATAASAQDFVITTIAGSDFVFRGDGGPATQAQLSQMYQLIADPQGNVLAADRTNHQIVKIAPNGILTVIAGNGIDGYSGDGGPATRASLSYPSAVALDRAGNLYIADGGNYRIRRVSSDGTIGTIAGNGVKAFTGDGGPAINATIDDIRGLAVDAAGNIYFSETGVHRVRRITTDGVVRTYAGNGTGAFAGDTGPATQASLREPWNVAIDSAGNLLIADFRNHRVRRVTPAGVITTVAGNGMADTTGDGGPALQASITGPSGVYVDAANNIYISAYESRVRVVSSTGVIRTFAGTGTPGFGGDGAAAPQSRLNYPSAVTGDAAGNIFISDSVNLRIRRVTPPGIIGTYAGVGQHAYSGDGGQAIAAAIGFPLGLALDRERNIFISDSTNHRVRKVGPNGIISTIAGTGVAGFSGDNGPSTQAALNSPYGLATDTDGNLYIADLVNGRVRRIARNGVITTVAGGVEFTRFPMDGQLATQAGMSPQSIALDGARNLYILDSAACVVYRVTPAGTIFRHAGRYLECRSSGDGGPATNATIHGNSQGSISSDSRGNLYIAEPNSGRVRRVGVDGTIRTVAGGVPPTRFPVDGEPAVTAPLFQPSTVLADDSGAFLIGDVALIYLVLPDGRILLLAGDLLAESKGDGGAASAAAIFPGAMGFDADGNLLVVDLDGSRVRAILIESPAFAASGNQLQFTAQSGGAPPLAQTVALTSSIPGIAFSTEVTTANGGAWLRAMPTTGASPRLLEVTADPAGLAPGTYQGTITIRSPLATPIQRAVNVAFEVTPGQAPRLELDKQNFSYAFPVNAAPRTQTLTVRNAGGGELDFTASAATASGAEWLSVATDGNRSLPAAPVTLTVTAAPGSLPAGTYTGRVTISTAGETRNVPLTMTISANDRAILLSQGGLAFTAVAGGGVVPPRTFEALNIGRGVVAFTVSTATRSGGPNWLSATPRSSSTDAAAQAVPSIEVRVNQAGLDPGSYYGLVQVDAPGAANSPQVITVFLDVLPAGSDPGPLIEPAELVFTAVAGRSSPGSKEVFVYNVAAAPKTLRSSATLPAPQTAGDVRLVNLPSDLTLAVDRPNRVIVQPFIGNLPPGVYQGGVNLQFDDGRVRTVRVQLILTAPEARSGLRFAGSCVPTKLLPAIVSLTPSVPVTLGWPVPITAEVRDDCGDIHDSGSVVVNFSNGDPALNLLSLKDGRWTGTWNARSGSNTTSLKLEAVSVERQIRGDVTLSVDSRTRQEPPVVELSGIVSAAGQQAYVPVAPGGIISILGERLADVTQSAAAPLPKQIGSTQVLMGGLLLPLLSVSPTRIDAVAPGGLTPNTSQQLLVQRGSTIARPVSVDVAPAQPAVLPGRITWVRDGGETAPARPGTPARAGDLLVINAIGLGLTNPLVGDGEAAPERAQTRDAVTATIDGVAATVESSGLSPGLVGMYVVNARVPQGVAAGDQAPVILTVAGQSSPPAPIAVQ